MNTAHHDHEKHSQLMQTITFSIRSYVTKKESSEQHMIGFFNNVTDLNITIEIELATTIYVTGFAKTFLKGT